MRQFRERCIAALLCCISTAASGQVLTAEANLGRARDVIVRQETQYVSPGQTGQGIVWDFSEIQKAGDDVTKIGISAAAGFFFTPLTGFVVGIILDEAETYFLQDYYDSHKEETDEQDTTKH